MGAQPFLVVGLTEDQALVAFASTNPTRVRTLGRLRGLQGDQRLRLISDRGQNLRHNLDDPTGTLGVDVEAGSDVGFDIHYTADGASTGGWGWPPSRSTVPTGCTGSSC